MNRWYALAVATPSGYEVRSDNCSEVYRFKTAEWAMYCADHFNLLEEVAKRRPVINYSNLSDNGSVRILEQPKLSNWSCHLFGATHQHGITYVPIEGQVPNAFVRWMMKICFGCTWVKG
jgi:hypothetical protein